MCNYAECRILFTIMLNVIMLSVIMLSVIMLSVIMLSVAMLNVSVVAPLNHLKLLKMLQPRANFTNKWYRSPDFLVKNVYDIDVVFQHHRRGSRRNADGVARRGLLPVGRRLQRQGPDP